MGSVNTRFADYPAWYRVRGTVHLVLHRDESDARFVRTACSTHDESSGTIGERWGFLHDPERGDDRCSDCTSTFRRLFTDLQAVNIGKSSERIEICGSLDDTSGGDPTAYRPVDDPTPAGRSPTAKSSTEPSANPSTNPAVHPIYGVRITVDEDGIYVATVPSVPGCCTQGDTREQALENSREAIACSTGDDREIEVVEIVPPAPATPPAPLPPADIAAETTGNWTPLTSPADPNAYKLVGIHPGVNL